VILIVDDDSEFLGAATAQLTRHGNHVLAAKDANRALALIETLGFEVGVALVDLNLGNMSGFELIQAIEAKDANLPVIAFSGVCSQSVLESATALGAQEVLRKPVDRNWHAAIERVRRRFDRKPLKG
jgi:CheY-like chemotaxis protein